jgi:P22 coat protein - gene protein 5.
MALNKEIWVADIVEDFIPQNSFLQKSVDHSLYVDGKSVHVPNAGEGASVQKNVSQFPVSSMQRTDTDLSYDLSTFYVTPMLIQKAETVELSYDKRQSVLAQSKNNLQRVVAESILNDWVPSSPVTIKTSGATCEAHIATATGNRKAFCMADVKKIKALMDAQDVAGENRCILLDSVMYNQLLDQMTDAQTLNFLSGAETENGVIGKWMGFNFFMRSRVLKATAAGTKKDWATAAAATDCAAGLAWSSQSVARAIGTVEAFAGENDPNYYGDIFSYSMRAGGVSIRADKKGVVFITQDSVA